MELNKCGYIYCFSNPSMPNIFKVGYSKRTPNNRLIEANRSSWIILPFKIEFAKKVINPIEKEHKIHTLLTHFTKRPNPRREFFETTIENIKNIFDLIDGEWWGVDMDIKENEIKKYPLNSKIIKEVIKSKQNIKHRYPTRLSFKKNI